MRSIALLCCLFIVTALTPANAAGWDFSQKEDEITSKLVSSTGLVIVHAGVRRSLLVRCTGSEIDILVHWNDFLGDDLLDPYRDVKFVYSRFDKLAAAKNEWSVSTNNESTFYQGDARKFVRMMEQHNQLVVRTTPHNSNPVTLTFSLIGFSEQFSKFKDQCIAPGSHSSTANPDGRRDSNRTGDQGIKPDIWKTIKLDSIGRFQNTDTQYFVKSSDGVSRLSVRCISGETDVLVYWAADVGDDGIISAQRSKYVSYQFDQNEPVKRPWNVGKAGETTLRFMEADFLNGLNRSEKLRLATSTIDDYPVVLNLQLDSFHEAIESASAD